MTKKITGPLKETSPHTRGKLSRSPLGRSLFRNIPAYAGKAFQNTQLQEQWQKHPRIRGESPSFSDQRVDKQETSPHTRGKPKFRWLRLRVSGNIPAYAGKACKCFVEIWLSKKHPRIRGESRERVQELKAAKETSPHTRGKPRQAAIESGDFRNIPAYAGKATTY